ncbi:MAG: hypothetical protein GY715_12650 [Planctomycetes bacterium]|nr:hypothetical protein [Planctomycetota bacterium]
MSRPHAVPATLALLVATAAHANAEPPPSGIITVPAFTDLGELVAGSLSTRRVWLVNASLETIGVKSASGSCGCTRVLQFAPRVLGPGEAYAVDLVIEAPKKPGSEKSVSMTFIPEWGAPVTTWLRMRTVETAPEPAPPTPPASVRLVPTRTDLGEIIAGQHVDVSAWLINDGPTTTRVDEIKADGGCTRFIGFEPTDVAPGAARLVRLRITPTADRSGAKKVPLTARLGDGGVAASYVTMTVTGSDAQVVDHQIP